MTPRIDVVAVPHNKLVKDLLALSIQTGYSKFPVYKDGKIDNIIGIVYLKDVIREYFQGNKSKRARELMKEPYFVPENKKIDDLLREMQARKITIAIVLDEFGGFSGIVTMEDILEELVGEIQDEHTFEEPLYEKLSDLSYIVNAKLTLDDLKELFSITDDIFEDYDVDTVGGLAYYVLGEVPEEGEEFRVNGLKFRIIEVEGQRVERILVEKISRRRVEE